MDTLGKMLYERRDRGSLSQRAAARELKVAPQTYIWWERDATTPRLAKAGTIARWLGIPEAEVRLARRHAKSKGVGLHVPDAQTVRTVV